MGHSHEADARPFPPDEYLGNATPGKVGMWVFLLSDAFMFGGLLLAYGIMRGGADVWHHPGEPLLGINFTAGLTFLLICSSVTMVLSLAAAGENDRKGMVKYLALTAVGGMLFLTGQYYEYFGLFGHGGLIEHGLHFGESAYASTFYVTTAFHGCHVFTGVVLLLITTFPRQTNILPIGVFQCDRAPPEAGHNEAHTTVVLLGSGDDRARRLEFTGLEKLDESRTDLWRGFSASGRAVDLVEPGSIGGELQVRRLVALSAVAAELLADFGDHRIALGRGATCTAEHDSSCDKEHSSHHQ
jgi:cytochrome c oxidase subunit 3